MEDFGLDLSNLLSSEELEELEAAEKQQTETPPPGQGEETKQEIIDTEDPTVDDLFGSESVGDDKDKEEHKEEKKSTTTSEGEGTSPANLYSSIAKAFKVDGIFSDLKDEEVEKVSSAEDFSELVEKQIEAKLDETQKRINAALNNGVDPSQIQVYENSIAILSKIKEEDITDETEKGAALRKNLIKTDYLNRGLDEARAEALAQRAFDNNTDIEDAKVALQGNKDFYNDGYKKLLKEAEESAKKDREKKQAQAEALRKSILEDSKAFGEIEVDKKTRQKIYDVINKPVYKNPENGQYMTELQKFEMEHKSDFMKYLAYYFVVSDDFKSLKNLETKVEKKVASKGIKELEHTLNTTARNPDGSLRFVSGVSDNDSYINSGWSIDTK